jgi:hypothetical protein
MALARWARMAPEERERMNRLRREGFLRRFEREVDPDNELPPAERARRAEQARLAFYAELRRRKLAKARQRRAAAEADPQQAAAAEAERKIKKLLTKVPPEARERLAAELASGGAA